jgi:predicted RNA methylase
VLTSAEKLADRLILCSGSLPRSVWVEVNGFLTLLGGEWNSKAGAHLFATPYVETMEGIMSGRLPMPERPDTNPGAFFPTPPDLAEAAIANSTGLARLPQGARVLECSAGRGALVMAVKAVRPDLIIEACEIDPANRAALIAMGVTIVAEDFLDLPEMAQYHAVVMNPPFSLASDKFAWVTHTEKAFRHLAEGGVLVAILPEALLFQSSDRIRALRALFLREGGAIITNPGDAFRSVGTMAKTVTAFAGGVAVSKAANLLSAAREISAVREFDESVRNLANARPTGNRQQIIESCTALWGGAGIANRRSFVFPEATRYSDLFSQWVPHVMNQPDAEIPGDGRRFYAQTPMLSGSISLRMGQAQWNELSSRLVVHDEGAYISFHDRGNGFTVVEFRFSKIIGSRLLAVIETASIVAQCAPLLAAAA